jgi:hypothetical protein
MLNIKIFKKARLEVAYDVINTVNTDVNWLATWQTQE